MSIKDLIERQSKAIADLLAERATHRASITEVRSAAQAAERSDLTDDEAAKVRAAQEAIEGLDAKVEVLKARKEELEAELRADEAADALAREVTAGAPAPTQRDGRVESVKESRTYSPESDPKGIHFLRDVALSQVMGNGGASMRLERHMQEEIVERAASGSPLVDRDSGTVYGYSDRAAGTSAFAGLVVPQYLVDLVAPHSKAGRPFADVCRHHDLPEQGMTVNISKITTGTSSAIQANQGDAVSETDIDDTLLTVNVQTNSGQQTLHRQAIERGTGIESTTLEDLFRAHGTTLDSTLLNQATNGLTNVATSIAYTDASPTAAELYPKLLQAPAAVEAALLDMDPNDVVAVMHSRRWYWLQSQLTSTWPLFGQPGAGGVQNAGVNAGKGYGSGFRGVLPSGAPVIVDNNIATNLGAGTNEDEVYFVAQSEAHLWEDPSAPFLIRAEQTKAANLGVLFVVYSYFAYTYTRRAHAQKIGGTGLVTPTF